jgi:hypothetical protein
MAQSVEELDVPTFDETSFNTGEGPARDAALAAVRDSQRKHWLSKTPVGYAVTRREDVFDDPQ